MSDEPQAKKMTAAEHAADQMVKRDGEIYVALGLFIVAVGIPVAIGTYFAAQTHPEAAVVNAVCSAVLLVIGASAITYGRFILARRKRQA